MVAIAKRMRMLKPLLSLRHGPGAAILPQYQAQPETTSSSLPQSPFSQATLLRIRLDFPPGNGPASKGARAFWRNHLRRLKYHNPALPITVNQLAQKGSPGNPGPAWRLFLDFEGEERALRELATEPKNEVFKQVMEEELRPKPKITLNDDSGGGKSKSQHLKPNQSAPAPAPVAAAAAAAAAAQSSPDPPVLTSRRTISLPLLNRPAGALWYWFQQRTKCIDVPESEADKAMAIEYEQYTVKAEADRVTGKKRMDKIRAQEEMLRLARREVERMKEET